jgi:hypothetical protein
LVEFGVGVGVVGGLVVVVGGLVVVVGVGVLDGVDGQSLTPIHTVPFSKPHISESLQTGKTSPS